MTELNNNLISAMSSNRVLDAAYAWLRPHRLNAMAMVLTPLLNTRIDLSAATHLKGQGGLKKAVTKTQQYSKKNTFIIKTDIADYYQSMNHHLLHAQLCEYISDKRVQSLLWQVMNRVHMRDGNHRLITNKSIPRGCPLSPLLAAVYLAPLDKCVKKHHLDYVRYMDDFVIFTKKRHTLKRILKRITCVLNSLGLKLAHAKTWLGRVDKGISFLGYDISPGGIDLSQRSFDRMLARSQRLYEQGTAVSRLTKYVCLWIKWARSGVSLNVKELKIKTTLILQNTFHMRLEL